MRAAIVAAAHTEAARRAAFAVAHAAQVKNVQRAVVRALARVPATAWREWQRHLVLTIAASRPPATHPAIDAALADGVEASAARVPRDACVLSSADVQAAVGAALRRRLPGFDLTLCVTLCASPQHECCWRVGVAHVAVARTEPLA